MIKYKVVDTLDGLEFNPDLPVFADIETGGLYIDVRLVQLYQPETYDEVIILDTDIISLKEIKKFIKPLWTIWYNASYDFGSLNMTTDRFDDLYYLVRTAYPEFMEFALDKVVEKFGLAKYYEGLDKKQLQKAGFLKGTYLSHSQLLYSATDTVVLSMLWQNKRIQKVRDIVAYKIDILNLEYAVKYQRNGLIVDQAKVREELDKLVDVIAENDKALGGLNPNSPKQVKEYLGTESSSKEILIDMIANGNEDQKRMAKLVYEQRRLLKRRTFLESYNYSKVYTRFNPAGAATGRFTSTGGDLPQGINAQQITRSLQYLFNGNTEDTVAVHADFSTAELRAGCSIMRDETMYEELKAGKDLHKIAATLALGGRPEDVSKADRQKGKAISFGFIFGMSAPSFVEYAFVNYGVTFTLEEAKLIKHRYSERYKNISAYTKKWWNDYATEFVQTPLGRRNKARLGTDAINYATQGCIAETTKLSIHYLVKDYPEALDYIYNVVHDAIYLRVPKGEEEQWADRLAVAMKRGWAEMCKCPMLYFKDIPMPVEVEYNDIVKEY